MKILQVVGYKNSGKTTLIQQLIKLIRSNGKTVALIKHHHIDESLIRDDVDTGKFTRAGADYSILNTPSYTEMTHRHDADINSQLEGQIEFFNSQNIDFVLIEGYKDRAHPKITLNYSFGLSETTDVNELGLKHVLHTFDLRYDEENVIEWFKMWSGL